MYTCILEQMQIQNVYLRVTSPLRTAKSSGVRSRTSFPAVAPAARCHESHRGHMCAISQVNPSFPRVERRKRRENHTTEHCLQHNIITLAYMLLLAILNMKLGGPREQKQLHKETHFHAQRLCKCAAA